MPRKSTKPHKAIPSAVLGALAEAFGKTVMTIMNWADNNDDRLTSDKAKAVFLKYDFEWKSSEVLEDAATA